MENEEHVDHPVSAVVIPDNDSDITLTPPRTRISAIFGVIFSGFAMMSDGYQVGVLSLVNVCFSSIYGDQFSSVIATRISNSLFIGCIIGQIGFGFICDRVGRKVGMLVTTFLVILGAALCAGTTGRHGSLDNFFWALTVYRGILGVGIGGEYPCSATSASEAADQVIPGKRGLLFVLVTGFVVNCGFVLSAIFPLILGAAGCSYEVIWRTSFAFGVLPPLSVLYFRVKMTNSEVFIKHSMKKNVPYLLIIRRYWKYLLGTGGCWFFYNFIAYPFSIFSGTIFDKALGADGTFVQIAEWSLLLNFFYLPGSLAGAFSADTIGRRKTGTLGFVLQGILGIFMGIWYKNLLNVFPLFVVLYGIFLMLGEYGPGAVLSLVSAEVYPTAVRGTAYGWSAACGKVGAFVGTSAFSPALVRFAHGDPILGQGRVFILGSCLSIVGGLFAWFLIPDYTDKQLGEEDEAFREYLASHGFDLSNFGEGNAAKGSATKKSGVDSAVHAEEDIAIKV
ncbi:Plasma membrane permease, mediates uptake of glycerophosphoinositol and glycerophosphocholine [Dissophora globulifera]|nr:Plasma membrane permease, mediates uptake of glycerophosphoinositol and glycerophosphocholine [Dissophora globulifera]